MSRAGAYAEAPIFCLRPWTYALNLAAEHISVSLRIPARQNRHDDSLFKATTRPHPGRLTARIDARPCGRAGHSAFPCYRSRLAPCTLIELCEKLPLSRIELPHRPTLRLLGLPRGSPRLAPERCLSPNLCNRPYDTSTHAIARLSSLRQTPQRPSPLCAQGLKAPAPYRSSAPDHLSAIRTLS